MLTARPQFACGAKKTIAGYYGCSAAFLRRVQSVYLSVTLNPYTSMKSNELPG